EPVGIDYGMSYATIEQVTARMPGNTRWASASMPDPVKQAWIDAATLMIDDRADLWAGEKADESQPNEFPRNYYGREDGGLFSHAAQGRAVLRCIVAQIDFGMSQFPVGAANQSVDFPFRPYPKLFGQFAPNAWKEIAPYARRRA